MSKAVLISIQPQWCDLIANGLKTVEVRKTMPKLETPFKVYIYETKGFYKGSGGCLFNGSGKVIGEFVCDKVAAFRVFENGTVQDFFFEKLKHSCLSYDEIAEYIGRDKVGYSWHISDLVIYDKPRELSGLVKLCNHKSCVDCEFLDVAEVGAYEHTTTIKTCLNRITKPPQSWCYVESKPDNKKINLKQPCDMEKR